MKLSFLHRKSEPALLIAIGAALWGTIRVFGAALLRHGLSPLDVVAGRTVVAAA